MTTTAPTTAQALRLGPGDGERIWITGDTVTIKASGAATGGSLTVLEVEANPGAGPPPHTHATEDEAFYVLEGEFEIQIGDEVRPAAAGAFAFVPRGTVHRFSCTGDRPGRMLIAFTPGGLDDFFRESGRPAVDDGPAPPVDEAEIARTEASARRHGLSVVAWGG